MDESPLAHYAQVLYGDDWIDALALSCALDRSTVEEYAAGTREVPDELLSQLAYRCYVQETPTWLADAIAIACKRITEQQPDTLATSWASPLFDSAASIGPPNGPPKWIALRLRNLVWLCRDGRPYGLGFWDDRISGISHYRVIVPTSDVADLNLALRGTSAKSERKGEPDAS